MITVTEATATAGALKRLSDEGVSIWLDDLSRRRIESGNLAELVATRNVVGVTTNPSIFQAAIGSGEGYEEQLTDLAVRGVTVDEAVRMMTTADVRAAADVLRPVYDATGGRDGRVSIEVDPRLAHDTTATIAEAKQLAWLVDRPNVMIKIPATKAGLPAITEVIGRGHQRQRHADLLPGALPRGHGRLPRRPGEGRGRPGLDLSGHPLRRLVLRLPRGRRDRQAADGAGHGRGPRPARAAPPSPTRGSPTRRTRSVFAGTRWTAARRRPRQQQRPLWASTGVKDPAYKDTLYVDELVAPGTVNTMPEATLNATADHGGITGDTVTGGYAAGPRRPGGRGRLGISYDEVVQAAGGRGRGQVRGGLAGAAGRRRPSP